MANTVDLDTRALERTANKLRISTHDVHTVVNAYMENTKKPDTGKVVAAHYGGAWYVVGHKSLKKDFPEGTEIVGKSDG